MKLKILIILLLVSPLAICFIYKPSRVFLPEFAGVICLQENICIEDKDDFKAAENLYLQAKNYVQEHIAVFEQTPKIIFCSTQSCFEGFGFSKASAQSVGTVATVVGPNGWKKYIIEHEMTHHIQNEKLGTIKFISMPTWFVEGMAYSFSEDPRKTLAEPWNSHRIAFNKWYSTIEPGQLWQKAEKL